MSLITGRVPFKADTVAAIMVKALRGPLPRPSLFVKEIPGSVERIIFKAMAKDAKERYEDMRLFAEAFEKLIYAKADKEKTKHSGNPDPEKLSFASGFEKLTRMRLPGGFRKKPPLIKDSKIRNKRWERLSVLLLAGFLGISLGTWRLLQQPQFLQSLVAAISWVEPTIVPTVIPSPTISSTLTLVNSKIELSQTIFLTMTNTPSRTPSQTNIPTITRTPSKTPLTLPRISGHKRWMNPVH